MMPKSLTESLTQNPWLGQETGHNESGDRPQRNGCRAGVLLLLAVRAFVRSVGVGGNGIAETIRPFVAGVVHQNYNKNLLVGMLCRWEAATKRFESYPAMLLITRSVMATMVHVE